MDEAYALAKKVLTENRVKLDFIAAYLVKYEVMDGEQFLYVMEDETPTEEELTAMVEKRAKQSEAENRAAAEEKAREEAERAMREALQDEEGETTATEETDGDDSNSRPNA